MKLNYSGVLAAITTMALPFSGIWWQLRIGEAINVAFSPFEAEIVMFGNQIIIPVIQWITASFKVLIVLAGFLMLLASLWPDKWWSAHLMRFGSFKVLGLTVLFFLSILALKYGSSALLGQSGLPASFEIPVSGSTSVEVQNDGIVMRFQLSTSFGDGFWFAIMAALLGVTAHIHQRRLASSLSG